MEKPLHIFINLMKKPKIAILSLTACEGCQIAILDLGPKFLDLLNRVEIVDFPLIEERPEPKKIDIIFIEGTPITKQDFNRLYRARKKAKILVALGACACLGGIAEIKNYRDKEEKLRYVYKNIEGIQNPDIQPLKELIKVDFEIPGCPINGEEFLKCIHQLRLGRIPSIPKRPVCFQCQLGKAECLLMKGKPCLGPIILGDCGAVCPLNNYPCDGCRGPIEGSDFCNLRNILEKMIGKKEVDLILERFGIKDIICK